VAAAAALIIHLTMSGKGGGGVWNAKRDFGVEWEGQIGGKDRLVGTWDC
jgi:hypothetical protein